MKKKDKVFIMNHHGDELVNKWILQYIIQELEKNKNLDIYLENVFSSEFHESTPQNLDNISNSEPLESTPQNYELQKPNYKEVTGQLEEDENADLSYPFLELAMKLVELQAPIKGLKSEELHLHHRNDNKDVLIGSSKLSVEKKHDEFMLNIIKKANGPFIAIVGSAHISSWVSNKDIDLEECKIILPTYDKIYDNTLDKFKTEEDNTDEHTYEEIEEFKQKFKLILIEDFKLFLNTEGVEVVDIDPVRPLMGEDN